MAWNGSVRTHYNQIAQGREQDNLFFALGFYLSLMLWYRLFLTKPRYRGTVKYYAQIHLQVWQKSVCTGQGNLPLIT